MTPRAPQAPRTPQAPRAAVVTGIGVIAPNGLGTDEYWEATLEGRSGIEPLTRFDPSSYPVRIAGEVTGYEAAEHLPSRLIPQTDRMTQMALSAADWALEDAKADGSTLPEYSAGVVTASASGGFEFGQRELEKLWSKGANYVSAYQSYAWFYAVNTGQISIRNQMRGASGVLVTEQAGGLDAAAQARRRINRDLDLVVTGGVDASLCPWAWVAQITSGRLSVADAPDRAYTPFAPEAAGFVPGEGGAILIVEGADAAERRHAPQVYGTIAGYAATFDPPPGSGRPGGLRRAVEGALRDARVDPGDVDAVFADAAGLADLDRAEAEALTAVFGPEAVPVTAPKTMTGRLYSGGSALDLATALLSVTDGVIPPTVNVDGPDPAYGIDLVTGPRTADLNTVLVLSRGFGGFNSALVVRSPERPNRTVGVPRK